MHRQALLVECEWVVWRAAWNPELPSSAAIDHITEVLNRESCAEPSWQFFAAFLAWRANHAQAK